MELPERWCRIMLCIELLEPYGIHFHAVLDAGAVMLGEVAVVNVSAKNTPPNATVSFSPSSSCAFCLPAGRAWFQPYDPSRWDAIELKVYGVEVRTAMAGTKLEKGEGVGVGRKCGSN